MKKRLDLAAVRRDREEHESQDGLGWRKDPDLRIEGPVLLRPGKAQRHPSHQASEPQPCCQFWRPRKPTVVPVE